MINNDTLVKWYHDLRNLKGITWGNALRVVGSIILVLLAVALTACTAGTWWTIAKELPFFVEKILSTDAITKLQVAARIVMGIINPIVMFFSSLSFNLPNIKETYDMFNAKKEEQEQKSWLERTKEKDNYWQIFNPFRLALFLTVTPLKLIFFFGHLISIGLIDDRVPGIPQIVTAGLGILSEFFEDAHYFLGSHDHKHPKKDAPMDTLLDFRFGAEASHNHEDDIPATIIKCIFLPLYLLASGWDAWASTGNKRVDKKEFTFDTAFDKFWGIHHHHHYKPAVVLQEVSKWEIDKEVTTIERKKESLGKAFFNKPLARTKIEKLTDLQISLDDSENNKQLRRVLVADDTNNKAGYNTHRFKLFSRTTNTATETMRAQVFNTLHRESPEVVQADNNI